jgi:hypothetical protein
MPQCHGPFQNYFIMWNGVHHRKRACIVPRKIKVANYLEVARIAVLAGETDFATFFAISVVGEIE